MAAGVPGRLRLRHRPLTHELRTRAAAGLLVPASVVTGASAAVLWGLTDLAGPEDDVEVTVAPVRPRPIVAGVRVRRAALQPGELTELRQVPVTTAAATGVAVSGRGPPDEAVVVLGRLVAAGAVDRRHRHGSWVPTGAVCRRPRGRAGGLASGDAPATAAPPVVVAASGRQYTVRGAAGLVARVDVAWPARRLAVEYDGAWHAEAAQFAADRRRPNRLTAAGRLVVFVTAEDLRRPEQVIARIAAALGA